MLKTFQNEKKAKAKVMGFDENEAADNATFCLARLSFAYENNFI